MPRFEIRLGSYRMNRSHNSDRYDPISGCDACLSEKSRALVSYIFSRIEDDLFAALHRNAVLAPREILAVAWLGLEFVVLDDDFAADDGVGR